MVWLRSANISSLGRKKLLENLYHTYTKERIEQLFNIIIEWPDSQAALEDVRVCLGNTDLRGHLTRSLNPTLHVHRFLNSRAFHIDLRTLRLWYNSYFIVTINGCSRKKLEYDF